LQLLKSVRQLELALLDGEKEARAGSSGNRGSARLLLHSWSRANSTESKHIRDLFACVVLATSEDVRFRTFRIANLMDGRLTINQPKSHLVKEKEHTIVPNVMSPTKAKGGSRLKLIMMESFNAFKLSSS
jgi:hypothetical protein